MTEISFSLIRSQNPEITTASDIEDIDSIRLSNCNIEEIDNLELFHHINELNLSRNRIQRLTNLSILFKLKILDVSYNNITSQDLKQSIKSLPKTLISINLTGNPCVDDEEALMELQDALPEVIIAIEVDSDDENPSSEREGKLSHENKKTNEENEEEDEEEERLNSKEKDKILVLNNEEVLKSIVERKCLIQNTTNSFKLEATIQDLNHELERLIEEANSRRQTKKTISSPSKVREESFTEKFSVRKQELIDRNNQREQYDYHDALDRIRNNARKRLQEIKVEHQLALSNH